MDKIAVVILNYNGVKYLEQFLPSVIEHSQNAAVWVVDNCSADDSLKFLRNHFPQVTIIALEENGGYSRGYNRGLSKIEAEYFVLLNSDVEVTPGWLAAIDYMDRDKTVAAAQPAILDFFQKDRFEYAGAAGGFIDILGYPFCRGRLFQTLETDEGQYHDHKKIFWATGACLFIRSEAFFKYGLFDEEFFAHMEEIDLCWRLNNAGLNVMYYGDSKVYHVGGGTLHKSNPRKTYLNFHNGLALLYKNYKWWELWGRLPVRIVLDMIACIKFIVFENPADGLAVVKAHWHFFLKLPAYHKKRQRNRKQIVKGVTLPIYKRSVVLDYFIRGKKKYTDLFAQ